MRIEGEPEVPDCRPSPMQASDAARQIAAQAQQIYQQELNLPLRVVREQGVTLVAPADLPENITG